MADVTTVRIGRIALVVAAGLALSVVGTRAWREATPAAPPPSQATSTGGAPQIDALLAQTAARPDDADAWARLGALYFDAQRFTDATAAYRRAAGLAPADAQVQSSLGETLFAAGPGNVLPAEAREAFGRALKVDPRDYRARYFLAVGRDLDGDHRGAITDWLGLLRDTPAGAPWQDAVVRTVEAVGAKHGIEVATRLAALRPAPPTGAASQPVGDQQAMIAAMVDGLDAKLKTNPNNVDGWIMLMRSRVQLRQRDAAQAALRDALAANRGSAAVLNDAARGLGL